MRLIMMGTGPFAVPTLRSLYRSPHEVLALVTRPPRALHDKTKALPNPMRTVAIEHGTPVMEPESINTDEARAELSRLAADLMIVCDYGQILAPATLAAARLGGINLHASLLPQYRGAAPIHWAIYHGERETGVTVIHMTPQVDAGPALAQVRTHIGADETAVELEARLAEMGAPVVCQVIDLLASGQARPIEQDAAQASGARRLRKTDGQVDWTRSAIAIRNQVRAMQPWPKTYTFWHRQSGPPVRLILERVAVAGAPRAAAPGTVLTASGSELIVAAGAGAVAIEQIQPAGKRSLTAAELLRGYGVQPQDRLGPEA